MSGRSLPRPQDSEFGRISYLRERTGNMIDTPVQSHTSTEPAKSYRLFRAFFHRTRQRPLLETEGVSS